MARGLGDLFSLSGGTGIQGGMYSAPKQVGQDFLFLSKNAVLESCTCPYVITKTAYLLRDAKCLGFLSFPTKHIESY